MKKISLPYFKDIDFNALKDYYEADIEFKGQAVSLDLNLDDEYEDTWAEDYVAFMSKIDDHYTDIRKVIKGYYPEDGMVKEFVTYHMEEIPEEMNEELEKTDKNLPEEDRVLSLLKLERIGFYFAEDNFSTWDFKFGDFSDQILVIITDKKGEILDITWES